MTPAAASTTVIVSHFHWDREWYRTMQGFRARLVDAVDQVLDLASEDDEFRFVLDGQIIVLEDYTTVRPGRRDQLVDLISSGRLTIGPWYVQPDSLLPSGESHVRNLLEGARAAADFGPTSEVAYVPDSFGHPAQFPQLFAGFGLTTFVYWRGNGNELDDLGPRWLWQAPDGSSVRAFHLTDGYFAASRPPRDTSAAVDELSTIVRRLRRAGEVPVIVMNGFDHTRPDQTITDLLEPLQQEVGGSVVRGSLDNAVNVEIDDLPEFEGELVGGRTANLLPGVWSTRTNLKIRNRHCEDLLLRWTEPWAALGRALGLADETASIRNSWRSLLMNQAHDSICGCSIDAVHRRMESRYDDSEGLANETISRILDRLAGRGIDREVPDLGDLAVAVFNPTGRPQTSVVTIPLDAHPAFTVELGVPGMHSVVEASLGAVGFEIDGSPARVVASTDPNRVRWLPGQSALDVQFVATDVPAFGSRRYELTISEPESDTIDNGREISLPGIRVVAESDGCVTVETDSLRLSGLFAIDDVGDRGDSYDFDRVGDSTDSEIVRVEAERHRHASGIQTLHIQRVHKLPSGLDDSRRVRSSDTTDVTIDLSISIAPGVPGVHVEVAVHNTADDHRLRLAFPTGSPVAEFTAATTFDVTRRTPGPADAEGWAHVAPSTFCHHGMVEVNGLTVLAAGLQEGEVDSEGTLFLTLLRSIGWLARYDLDSRTVPAGPEMEVPGAQRHGTTRCSVTLLEGVTPARVCAATTGLRGVLAGPTPILEDGRSLLSMSSEHLVITTVKPAEDGDGIVVRVMNPTDSPHDAVLELGIPIAGAESVRLDERPDDRPLSVDHNHVAMLVAPHGQRSVTIHPA